MSGQDGAGIVWHLHPSLQANQASFHRLNVGMVHASFALQLVIIPRSIAAGQPSIHDLSRRLHADIIHSPSSAPPLVINPLSSSLNQPSIQDQFHTSGHSPRSFAQPPVILLLSISSRPSNNFVSCSIAFYAHAVPCRCIPSSIRSNARSTAARRSRWRCCGT